MASHLSFTSFTLEEFEKLQAESRLLGIRFSDEDILPEEESDSPESGFEYGCDCRGGCICQILKVNPPIIDTITNNLIDSLTSGGFFRDRDNQLHVKADRINRDSFAYTCPFCREFDWDDQIQTWKITQRRIQHKHCSDGDLRCRTEHKVAHCAKKPEWQLGVYIWIRPGTFGAQS